MADTMQSHYGRPGIVERILQDLVESGIDLDEVSVEDLNGIDEFHVGGREASARIVPLLDLGADDHLIDVGCGIGGPARHFAAATGARVHGIDLTPEFVAAAQELTRRVGLSERVSFRLASGTDIPFEDDRFDAATLMHVGMNIEDKPTLLAEMARVTRRDGTVLVYDLMRVGEGDLVHPMPWASNPAFSFVDRPAVYEAAAEAAGLVVIERMEFGDLARDFFDTPSDAPPTEQARGGDSRPADRFRNARSAILAGIITPIALVLKTS